jgi:hypothetical protein
MTSQIIPFDFKSTAVVGQSFFADAADEFTGGVASGFPSLSIKGREFAVTRGGETKTIMRKNEDGDLEAVRSINVVILKGNPHLSKVYYEGKYEEGSDGKPTCFSNDGQRPDPEAAKPQCDTCALCPQNQWGSRITDAGKKARNCSDSRRLAVAAADAINDPMLVRVPATSTKSLAEYAKQLKVRGKALPEVLTKLSFTPGVAFPSLEFEPKGLLGEDLLREIAAVRNSDLVAQICGVDAPQTNLLLTDAPQPKPATKVEAPKPAKQDAKVDEDEIDEEAVIAAALAEAKAKAKARAKAAKDKAASEEAPKPKVKLEAKVEDTDGDDELRKSLNAALGDDFDDLDL